MLVDNHYRPAKSSDKTEDLPLLGIKKKSSAFPTYFEILPLVFVDFLNCV